MGIISTATSFVLLGSLQKAEEQDSVRITKSVLGVVAQTQEDMSKRFEDWAAYDDSYQFIVDKNQEYINSGLAPEVLTLTNLDVILYINKAGQIVWATGWKPEEKKPRPIPSELLKHITYRDRLLQHKNVWSSLKGIISVSEGILMVSSYPIVPSKRDKPSRGVLVVGRFLDYGEIAKIERTTRASVNLHSLNEEALPSDFQGIRSSLPYKDEILVKNIDNNHVAGYSILKDIYNRPSAIIRVSIPREIYHQGQSSLRYLIAALLFVGLIFWALTNRLLDQAIRLWKERQEKEEQYRAVVTQSSDSIATFDANSLKIVEANSAFKSLLGFSDGETEKLSLSDIKIRNHAREITNLTKVLSRQTTVLEEFEVCGKNGKAVEVEISAKVIHYQTRGAYCVVIRDITERKKAELALRESEKRLAWQASHDSLTELFNRREFERTINNALVELKNSSQQHVLLYIDLDQFKIINDTCGHLAGDELLKKVSSTLKSLLPRKDIIARLGGDEFGVVLFQCTLENAVTIGRRILERIEKMRFTWDEKIFSVTLSIGLVTVDSKSKNFASILSAADLACLNAKNQGRNRICVYHSDDHELIRQRLEMGWISRLKQALDEDHFCLYCQPIAAIDSDTSLHRHFEVLLRLQDQDGNIISPASFIPAAERYNLMTLVDRWVVNNLFQCIGNQPDSDQCLDQSVSSVEEVSDVYAVNLSGDSLNDERFIDYVTQLFEIYKVSPQSICFEITETVAIKNLERTERLIQKLHKLGCLFALDDFGNGMSSLAYLKNLSVDFLKIDGAFVRDISTDKVALEMVRAIAKLASVMEIQTIAEFVEDAITLEQLKQLGVDYAQGYLISKPYPIANRLTTSHSDECLN
jgi:diguanylate cyclase (GGDEF)-like protein/PAS domain S-box-containing protein